MQNPQMLASSYMLTTSRYEELMSISVLHLSIIMQPGGAANFPLTGTALLVIC